MKMNYKFPRLDNMRNKLSRSEKLEFLKELFKRNLTEDPINGTIFDFDVLGAIEALESKYRLEIKDGVVERERKRQVEREQEARDGDGQARTQRRTGGNSNAGKSRTKAGRV